MIKSSNAKRMQRRHSRRRSASMNLVALMDIFTILVFFLLVNSSDVQEMPSSRNVKLPESTVAERVRETVTVLVTTDQILVQGEAILSTRDALAARDITIAPLREALQRLARNRLVERAADDLGEVTVLGDRTTSFELLKKVMASATAAGFATVSLAVQERGARKG